MTVRLVVVLEHADQVTQGRPVDIDSERLAGTHFLDAALEQLDGISVVLRPGVAVPQLRRLSVRRAQSGTGGGASEITSRSSIITPFLPFACDNCPRCDFLGNCWSFNV